MITSPIYGVYWFPTQQFSNGQQQQQQSGSNCGFYTSSGGVGGGRQRRSSSSLLLGFGGGGGGGGENASKSCSSLLGSGSNRLGGGLLYGGVHTNGGPTRQQCFFAFGQVNGSGPPYVGYWRNSAATVAAIFGARNSSGAGSCSQSRPLHFGEIMETR